MVGLKVEKNQDVYSSKWIWVAQLVRAIGEHPIGSGVRVPS